MHILLEECPAVTGGPSGDRGCMFASLPTTSVPEERSARPVTMLFLSEDELTKLHRAAPEFTGRNCRCYSIVIWPGQPEGATSRTRSGTILQKAPDYCLLRGEVEFLPPH